MKRQEFDQLVQKIETQYNGRQKGLERATYRWVLLGLATVVGWIVLLFASALGLLILGIIQIDGAGVVFMVLSGVVLIYACTQAGMIIFLGADPSQGVLLKKQEAPALWGMIESLQNELKCKPFYQVLIVNDLNASVSEVPRLGLLGWNRASLRLGLTLMMIDSPEHFRTTLAHELAHRSARHTKRTSHIYQLIRTWNNVVGRMMKPPTGRIDQKIRIVIGRFLDWYWPRLNARIVTLARFHEFEADRLSADVAGIEASAVSLWRMGCFTAMLAEKFWPDLYAEASRSPEPPTNVFDRIREAMRTPPSPSDGERWMSRLLNMTTHQDETHPAFSERVRAFGFDPSTLSMSAFPEYFEDNAASRLLGNDLPAIEAKLAADWHKSAVAYWHEQYRKGQSQAKRQAKTLENVAPQAATETADLGLLWASAGKTIQGSGIVEAIPQLRNILAIDPVYAPACGMLGQHFDTSG